jgi:regulation of enolase protein 1 (concanavalin A-like superfamily)
MNQKSLNQSSNLNRGVLKNHPIFALGAYCSNLVLNRILFVIVFSSFYLISYSQQKTIYHYIVSGSFVSLPNSTCPTPSRILTGTFLYNNVSNLERFVSTTDQFVDISYYVQRSYWGLSSTGWMINTGAAGIPPDGNWEYATNCFSSGLTVTRGERTSDNNKLCIVSSCAGVTGTYQRDEGNIFSGSVGYTFGNFSIYKSTPTTYSLRSGQNVLFTQTVGETDPEPSLTTPWTAVGNCQGATLSVIAGECPCPTFSAAPPNVNIINSNCGTGCTLTGGIIAAPSGTSCPALSTLQYQVNGGSWSTNIPTYNQSVPVQNIRTRCACNVISTTVSAESAPVSTVPGTLTNPVVPANGATIVNNPALAIQPTPPAVLACNGTSITPTGPEVINTPNPITCVGTRTYTWTYTCGNTSSIWSFIYTIIDDTPPMVTCHNSSITFNGQQNIPLSTASLVTATDNCGIKSITLHPSSISCAQVGQQVPVTVKVTDLSDNVSTCTSIITVGGLPCGWSQQPNGVNIPNGNNISYNTNTSVWNASSTNSFYASPFTSDQLAFAQNNLCGNGSITAQVTSISGGLGWAGVTMRESNAAGAKKAQLMTNLSAFSRREFRTTTGGSAFPQQFPSQNRYWLRITRTGSQFVMSISPNGTTWYPAGSQNITMTNCVELGLVVTNYNANSTVTATFVNVSVTGGNPARPAIQNQKQIFTAADFSIMPNPSSGVVDIDLRSYSQKKVKLEVYNLHGKLLRTVNVESNVGKEELDLTYFANGMYLIRVSAEGLPDVTQRVVLNTKM